MINLADFKLIPHHAANINIGDTFNKWTVLGVGKIEGTYRYMAVCKCACGSPPKAVRIDGLKNGTSHSCGCEQIESATKHGNWKHPLYKKWHSMMFRCYNKKDKRYNRYGGRGITVCDRWHDLNNFISDMYSTYEPDLQIDRINNEENYLPSNCKWSTRIEQARNKSNNIFITHDGKTLCIAEWSDITGITYQTLWDRKKAGWSDEKIITTPPKHSKSPYKSKTY